MAVADNTKVRFWVQVLSPVMVLIGAGFGGYVLNDIRSQLQEGKVSQDKLTEKVGTMNDNLTKVSTTLTEGAMKTLASVVETNGQQQVQIDGLKDRVGKAEGRLDTIDMLRNLQLPAQGRK